MNGCATARVSGTLQRAFTMWASLSNPLQDSAVQVTMGPVNDRTREHLGTTDKQIIAFQRIMLRAAKAFEERKQLPATVDDNTLYRVRGTAFVLPKGID